MELRVAEYCVEAEVLGPGRRFILYLQGCPFRCPGCCSPEWQETDGGRAFKVEELIALMEKAGSLDGLTVSGGEPLYQAEPLKELLLAVRERFPDWGIILFTGYDYGTVNGDGKLKSVLNLVDLAVCGPFVAEEFVSFGLRGSKNQKFVYVTDRFLENRELIERGNRKVKVKVLKGEVLFTGIPVIPDLYFWDWR